MNTVRYILLGLTLLPGAGVVGKAEGGTFFAFSMREAERRLTNSNPRNSEVGSLAGITRIAGMVYDETSKDLILVGQVVHGEESIRMDDLVVAMRSVLTYNEYPYVSIDRTEDTDRTGKQAVHFKGAIENTHFGRQLLEADIVLKKLSLGKLPSDVGGVESYMLMSVDYLRRRGGKVEDRVSSRFWFYPQSVALAKRRGVFAIREAMLGLETTIQYAVINGERVSDLSGVRDEIGDAFCQQAENALEDLSAAYPAIRRLKTLLDLVALAKGMQDIETHADLGYWLRRYRAQAIETPTHFDLIGTTKQVQCADGKTRKLTLSGGITLNPMVLRLKAGDVEALRDAVLQSRPAGNALRWVVPLDGWHIPGWPEAQPNWQASTNSAKEPGFSLDRLIVGVGGGRNVNLDVPRQSFHYPPVGMPKFDVRPNLPWQGASGNINGVMLSNTARMEGLDPAQVQGASIDPSTGSFNLLVQGKNVELKDTDLRKFITVLWAVYFGSEDPGISIDPISADSDHQLVRFIGNIVDTGMARTLLDADYYMKRCAIGQVRPRIRGFQSVDELIGGHGISHLGAGRRFWFVPRDMQFRRLGDALLFDGGQMTLLTEKLFLGQRGVSDPADQAFAQFWTDNYWEFAAANPVYEELFEYARLTALAKYLKESGVSLQWFLLSNRHLVLREDIPGTVPTLRARSNVLRVTYWSGGVNLAVDMSDKQPGRYIIDETAAKAIQRAVAKHLAAGGKIERTSGTGSGHSTLSDKPFNARLPDGDYTVLPAKSLSNGTGPGGITYHTDVGLRHKGEPGVELVRYNRAGGEPGLFGKRWDLYRPYAIRPWGEKMVKATKAAVETIDGETVLLDVYLPERMEAIDLISGRREVLRLDSESYSIVAWIPEDESKSRFKGMAYLSDGSCQLCEKSGCEFRFDRYMRLTDLIFSRDHSVRYEYEGDQIVSARDGFGGQVDLGYDDTGRRITSATGPAGKVEYRYLDDDLVMVRHPSGRRLVMIYEKDGSLSEVISKAGVGGS